MRYLFMLFLLMYASASEALSSVEPSAEPSVAAQPENQAPVFSLALNKEVEADQTLTFNVSAADPEGVVPTLQASSLPSGATFSEGVFSWTPTAQQAGSHSAMFITSDGTLTNSLKITVTVLMTEMPPVFEPVADEMVEIGQTLSFGVRATDPNGTLPMIQAQNSPEGAKFQGGAFNWTPGEAQAGSHTIKFIASDGVFAVGEEMVIEVIAKPAPTPAPEPVESTPPQTEASSPATSPAAVVAAPVENINDEGQPNGHPDGQNQKEGDV